MKVNEFKIMHSDLLQECMHMEDRLRGHYGLIKGKKDLNAFIKYAEKVGENTMGQLIKKLAELEGQYSKSFIKKLEKAKNIRNYYAHDVYCEHNPFNYEEVKKTDEALIIRNMKYIKKMNKELDNIYTKKYNKI